MLWAKNMNKLNFALSLILLTLPVGAYADCYDAEALSADAYSYARRAYNSEDLDSCQAYARRAMSAALDAESEASYCSCYDAEALSSDAYSYARRAYNSEDLDSCQTYARRARNAASDAESEAAYCN